ncbi:GGDEF domain-containing protein [Azospirillum canadense]|uniref:GGDEF domain-containing protein n=1 Tax=Azospirillum canadense TaxID=403962 RepID=UPI002226E98A|nr:GGDEF domain-containing protein [Azospirillum canadense]MCW2235780.1 diguanylate cyclase (GGDEF)-like protein [Azospirillum canadense]
MVTGIAQKLSRHGSSIAFRVVAVGMALVIFGAVVRIVFLSSFFKDKVEDLSAGHQMSIATYVAHDIDEKFKARLDLLQRSVAAMPRRLLSDPAGLTAWLAERQDASALFSKGMAVLPLDGKGVIAEYPPVPGRSGVDNSAKDWFLAARDGRAPAIGRPARSVLSGEPVIIMAAPVPGPDGAPVAILAGGTALMAPGFLNLVQENRIGRTGGFLLVSPRDKLFVAANKPDMVLSSTPPTGVNLLHDRAMAGYRGTGITVNAAGEEELSAIASVPTPGWFIVARLPTAEAFQSVEDVRHLVAAVSAITLVVMTVLVTLIIRFILRPLSEAARRMHMMADGAIPLAPLPIRRRDEVGDLALGFNYLLGKLREQEAALRESEARMAHIAHHDALTGLPNRAMFQELLRQAIARADRNGRPFALLYIDLNGFKPINDTLGHGAGDEVLRQVARRLIGVLRSADTVARIGGDEFAILLMEQEDARAASELVARKCGDAVSAPMEVEGTCVTVGLSVGIALYPEDGLTARDLLIHADQAMYAVKRSTGALARVT